MTENKSKKSFPIGYSELLPQFETNADYMKNWAKASDNALKNFSNNTNIRPTDWRILLPRAFYMDWSDSKTWQKSAMDPTIWFPLAFYPEEEKDRALEIINIAGDSFGNGKSEEKKEEEIKEKLQHVIVTMNINNNNTGKDNDNAGGNIAKDNTAENIAGKDIKKELKQ